MRRWLFVLVGMSACTPQAGGLGSTTVLGPTSTSTSTTGPASTTDTPPPDGSGDSVSSSTAPSESSSSTASSESSESSTGQPPIPPPPPPLLASCAEILSDDENAPTGTYDIERADNGMPVEVYCEMDLDGGGWTLVGRSRGGAGSQPFGWKHASGMLGDGGAPYSLDATLLIEPFTEILITERTGFATPVNNAYVVEVPVGFLDDYSSSQLQHSGARTVMGGCDPGGSGPTMLRRVGYTDNNESFYIRDNTENDPYGLFFDRFRLNDNNCNDGGDLHDDQGALFVR